MVAVKSDKQQNDEQATRLWRNATAAARPLARNRKAYLLRWCVASRFNGFEPKPDQAGQVATRDQVRRFAGEVCVAMGIDMMAPPDRTLADDEPYQAALALVIRLDSGQRRCLVEWLVKSELPYDRDVRAKALALSLNLRDLENMKAANEQKKKKGGGRRRKKR